MAVERTGLNRLKEYVRAALSLIFILSAELPANKIRQDSTVKGIKIFGNEIKLSQFADDTTLINADLGSLEKTLKIVEYFRKLAGLYLNVKKKRRFGWGNG